MASSNFQADHDGTTVRGSVAGDIPTKYSKEHDKSPSRIPEVSIPNINAVDLPFVDAEQYLDTKRPFCVRVDGARGGVLGALQALDRELRESGHASIFSRKTPVTWAGREVSPGEIGLYTHGGSPKILNRTGRYPGFPFGWWWARHWEGTFNLTETLFENHGLVVVQVSQNQAAICQDPQNQVFVVKNSGFVALAVSGSYKVLDIVDQTHLGNAIIDKYTKTVLAYSQDVLMAKKYVAATFLDIPANNIVVLQRENQLFELGAGQHHITQANVKIRGAFTRGEVQHELVADDIYTRDQVPVMMRVYLRWELQHPLQLTRHGYETPFDALQDKTRSILTQILAHLDYSSMAKSRNVSSGLVDPGENHEDDAQAAFVDAVRTQATDDLAAVAVEYGILLKDLAIVDRKFKGEIARVMDHLTTRALEAQVESTNLDRENNNRKKKQEGDLRVAELENQQRKAKAEADAQTAIAAAKGRAEALRLESEAAAQAILVKAKAEAEASRIVGAADAAIGDEFAQTQARARIEVQRTAAFGDKTVFVSSDMTGLGEAMALGKAMEVARKR